MDYQSFSVSKRDIQHLLLKHWIDIPNSQTTNQAIMAHNSGFYNTTPNG
jgi:hypothetical protein